MNTFTTFVAFSAIVCVTFANPPVYVNKAYNKDIVKVIKAPTLPAAVEAWPTKVSSKNIGPNLLVNGGIPQAGWNGNWAGALPINTGIVNPIGGIAIGEPYPCPFAGNGWLNNGYGLTGLSTGYATGLSTGFLGASTLGNAGVVVDKLAPSVLSVDAPVAALPVKSWAPSVISKGPIAAPCY